MKIASIGMQVRGGAGLSSLKLHQQFKKLGHESRFYVAHHTIKKDLVTKIPTKKENKKNWWNLGTVPLKENIENVFTSGFSGSSEGYLDEIYEWADIILLRWVTATISDYQISKWSHGKKPVFWCLSDMAPLTGGCHYSQGCFKYETDCADCHMVATSCKNLPSQILNRRYKLWGRLHIVSPSNWLAQCSLNSKVLGNKEISVIRTGVELDVFRNYDRQLSRIELGLPLDKKIVLFGADAATDERKGYTLLIAALRRLVSVTDSNNDLHLVVLGAGDVSGSDFPLPYTCFGRVDSRELLAKIFSAADVTILPYKEDNLPNVMLESLSCGTPVVAFDVGGMSDVITQGINGRLAIPFDTHDFARQIFAQLCQNILPSEVRAWAEKNINIEEQAIKYIKLFEEKIL